tara:strand:- start:4371 stop:5834 length:1464 start_codon:yes stop_codon:yes gene_type:complete
MQFNSCAFGIFMAVVFLLYWAYFNHPSRIRLRNGFILVVSYLFYGWWDWRFLSLIAISSLVDFMAGWSLGNYELPESVRRRWLALSLTVNLGLLGAFKYFNFFMESADRALSGMGLSAAELRLEWILPVGISFYTFQTLSYTIDIYRKEFRPVRDPIAFFAYVAFFPQLVAGPIERAHKMLPQFNRFHKIDEHAIKSGLLLVIWGLFKKIVIADRLALYVNQAYALGSDELSGPIALSTVVFFTLQIYVDFSAYSEIAIGLARMLGFELSTNFRRPLFGNGIQDFWKRWHISLTKWFGDYIMRPLRERSKRSERKAIHVIVLFLIIGLWHGASWNFFLWGIVNSCIFFALVPLDKYFASTFSKSSARLLSIIFGSVSLYLSLVLFRAETFISAKVMYAGLFEWSDAALNHSSSLGLTSTEWYFSWFSIGLLLTIESIQEWKPQWALQFHDGSSWMRWSSALIMSIAILIFGSYGIYRFAEDFIYFQF